MVCPADMERRVVVGSVSGRLWDEQVARNLFHSLKHRFRSDTTAAQLLFNHCAAGRCELIGCLGRVWHLMSLVDIVTALCCAQTIFTRGGQIGGGGRSRVARSRRLSVSEDAQPSVLALSAYAHAVHEEEHEEEDRIPSQGNNRSANAPMITAMSSKKLRNGALRSVPAPSTAERSAPCATCATSAMMAPPPPPPPTARCRTRQGWRRRPMRPPAPAAD